MMDIVGGESVHDEYGVFLGLDVGKSDHHAVALDPAGKRLHDAALPNTEAGLRKLLDKLARHGAILAVVDQPASIGALPVASPGPAGTRSATCPAWSCGGSLTCTPARRRPTPATPT
jgi:hypothetical protein